MGKNKQRFNKKEAVRFTLVPSFDENGKPITHFRPVQNKKSKVSSQQRQKLIREISEEVYDEIQINGRKVGQDQIPAFVLQQIKGRKDLVFNQKQQSESKMSKQEEGDLYQVVDVQEYDEEQFGSEQQQWIQQEDIIDEEQFDDMQELEGECEDQAPSKQTGLQQQNNEKPSTFLLKQEDFPQLSTVNLQGKQYSLTQEQIKLLDVLLPQNYQNFQIKGIKFEKYDEDGLPLSKKYQYQQFLATGKQGIVDSFVYVPETPTPIYDTDLKPSQMTIQLKQIQNALNFQGQEQVYDQLEDDFFSKLIKSQIQLNKKQKKQKKQKKKTIKNAKVQLQQMPKSILPKILQQQQKTNNIFAKYDELDEDILQEQITDEMLEKALNDFESNIEPVNNQAFKHRIDNKQYQIQEEQPQMKNSHSMNFSQIQKCQELFGKDGELDWRCLTKKEKKQYMKTKIIRNFYDQVRERQIEQKIKGKRNVTAQELHLKVMVRHFTFEEDHVMRKALEEDAKQTVDLEQKSSSDSSSQQEDIVEYRQRTSVISSNLNQISEPSNKKMKKKEQNNDESLKQLDELSATLQKLKTSAEKRNRNQTKEQRNQRKQKQKQVKKQKRQVKKEFLQKFNQQRKKHIKMTKPSDPLNKISYVKIH